MSKVRFSSFVFLILLSLESFASGRKKAEVPHAPLPESVLNAKNILIQNDSGYAVIADTTYSQLQAWGKYKIVTSKEKAELVLVLTVTSEQQGGTTPTYASAYNYKTGAWTSASGLEPTVDTWHFTQMSLIDPATGTVAWQDRRIWWRKHHPVEELITSLRARVEEQQKQAPK